MDSLRSMLDAVVCDQASVLGIDRSGRICETPPIVLLPGAFNPVHEGHWGLAAVAERMLEKPVAFELSVVNVDKPVLNLDEVHHRLASFVGRTAVWVTRLPTFVDKAHHFPGVVFVVGTDTAERILDPRYYPGGESGLVEGMALIRAQGCRFLVAGRKDRSGIFRGIDDLQVAPQFRDLFTAIPSDQFRFDISSMELRRR